MSGAARVMHAPIAGIGCAAGSLLLAAALTSTGGSPAPSSSAVTSRGPSLSPSLYPAPSLRPWRDLTWRTP
jgi:hypothetical protein